MSMSHQIIEDEAGTFWFEGISADSYALQIEADGTFDLGRLGPGTWKFRATHPSMGTITMQRSISGSSPITIVMSK